MEQHIGCKFGGQSTTGKTLVHVMHHLEKTQDILVRFPCYALENSVDTVDKGGLNLRRWNPYSQDWGQRMAILQTKSKAEDNNWENERSACGIT